jgi:hypothetical protein
MMVNNTKNEEFFGQILAIFHSFIKLVLLIVLIWVVVDSELLYKSLCHRVKFLSFYFKSPNIRRFANLGVGVIFLSLTAAQIMLLMYTLYQ